MRSPFAWIALLAVVGFMPLAHAQYSLEEQNRVSESQTLAGYAEIGFPAVPAEGVTVELRGSNWQTILASTTTNKKGHFRLEKPKTGNLFYVRLSAPGVNPYQLRVRIKDTGAKELTIHLHNAT